MVFGVLAAAGDLRSARGFRRGARGLPGYRIRADPPTVHRVDECAGKWPVRTVRTGDWSAPASSIRRWSATANVRMTHTNSRSSGSRCITSGPTKYPAMYAARTSTMPGTRQCRPVSGLAFRSEYRGGSTGFVSARMTLEIRVARRPVRDRIAVNLRAGIIFETAGEGGRDGWATI